MTTSHVAVLEGYGIRVAVERGQLVLTDGIGANRRTRRYPRIDRPLRRILTLGATGAVTLEGLRWCSDHNIAVTQIDTDNRIVSLVAAPGLDDARLRRAQALAATSDSGLRIAQDVLALKIRKQAAVLGHELQAPHLGATVSAYADALSSARTVAECVDAESHAANAYFGGWADRGITVSFAERDRARVPDHWHTFTSRASIADRGRSPRLAVTPINALLNYLYALAEAECRIALITLGLDPGMGVWHVDVKARDSLALDLLEVVRPDIDRYVLRLVAERHFRAEEFHETRTGQCRLMPSLAHELAATMPLWAREVAPTAERIAHLLSDTTTRASRSTPLTRVNSRPAVGPANGRRPRGAARHAPVAASTCRTCGVKLTEKRRELCPSCWPRTRAQLATARAESGAATLAERRAQGDDPTNTEQARTKRAASLAARKREQLAWGAAPDGGPELNWDHDIWPALSQVPLSQIARATGLSISACSRIRSGNLRPHQRHWPLLRDLTR